MSTPPFPYPSFEHAGLCAADMAKPATLELAHACLAHEKWEFLRQMQELGFDINATPKHELTEETLLHRAIRLHLYEELASKIDHLLELGADPHVPSGQSICPLGLLCIKARDMPNHRAIAAFEALERGGVRMTDRCAHRTRESLSRYLVDSEDAVELLQKYCPELAPWALSRQQALLLDQGTPHHRGASGRPRL